MCIRDRDWTTLAEATSDQFTGGPVLTRFEYTSETDLSARYVRFTSNTSTEWIFMDEIAVLTEVDDNQMCIRDRPITMLK